MSERVEGAGGAGVEFPETDQNGPHDVHLLPRHVDYPHHVPCRACGAPSRHGSTRTIWEERDTPRLITIPDVACANCGEGLAWRAGVGRYVISHDNGDDVCSRVTARIASDDREAASLAYRKADEAFQSKQVCRPGQPAQPTAAPSAAGGADGGAGRG